MRIAMIAGPYVPVPPEKYGGTERVIDHLITGLSGLGHEVLLVAPGDSQADCQLIPSVEKGLWFPRHKAEKPQHDRQVAAALRRTDEIIRSLSGSVDIFHSHGHDMLPHQHLPHITTLHGPLRFDELTHTFRRAALPHVCISHNQTHVFPGLNITRVVHNGLDPSEFPVVDTPGDYLVFIGRFDRDKNPHVAIQLALSLGMKLKLAGKIDFEGDEYFEQEIRPFLDHPLIEFVGEVDLPAKIDLLSHAALNLHPANYREAFGLTVVEAAYCGTPTLATARGAMPELIRHGETGMIAEDFEEGYSMVKAALALDRQAVAHHARTKFTYQRMAHGYARAYQKVISDYQQGQPASPSLLQRFLGRKQPAPASQSQSTKSRI